MRGSVRYVVLMHWFLMWATSEHTHEGQVHSLAKAPRGRATRLGIMMDVAGCDLVSSQLPLSTGNPQALRMETPEFAAAAVANY